MVARRPLPAGCMFHAQRSRARFPASPPYGEEDNEKDYYGAQLTPDANTEYKAVFHFSMEDDSLDDPYPMLPLVARNDDRGM